MSDSEHNEFLSICNDLIISTLFFGMTLAACLAMKEINQMDKLISNKEQRKRRRKLRWRILAISSVIIVLFWGFRYLLKPRIDKNDFIVAVVKRGDIQNALTATGLIVPAYEIELNAPVNSAIKTVLLSLGHRVNKGDLIMELDDKYVNLQYEQSYDEWALKENNIAKLKLAFDKNLRDLGFENQIKNMELEGLEAALKDLQKLLLIGGTTEEEVERASLNVNIAKLRNQQLANELDFQKKSNKSDKRNLELELNIQAKKLAEYKTRLDETSVKAPQSGVITWINEDLGRKINEGELIARIANLEKFKIEASCSDRYAHVIKTAMPVNVRINNRVLKGSIQSILPAVENNTLKFIVKLENDNSEQLRPNMKVEVFIVTDEKKGVLKIKKGPAFGGGSQQLVFVIRDHEAVRRPLVLGISNADFIEISGDIREGDKIIISDTRDFEHLTKFKIQ